MSVTGNADRYYLTRDNHHTVYVVGEVTQPIRAKFCEDDEDEKRYNY